VFMRTRYAVALYMVIFGSIIVAAYKMGMVHERPRVIRPSTLDAEDSVRPTAEIDPSTVVEIRDPDERPQGFAAPGANPNPS